MNEHRVFKTEIIPVLMMIVGISRIAGDVRLAAAGGICIWLLASVIDRLLR